MTKDNLFFSVSQTITYHVTFKFCCYFVKDFIKPLKTNGSPPVNVTLAYGGSCRENDIQSLAVIVQVIFFLLENNNRKLDYTG